ncbi:MAG: hypothetical protein AB1393_08110 [Candidatus Edwardsbacteria bacterium]
MLKGLRPRALHLACPFFSEVATTCPLSQDAELTVRTARETTDRSEYDYADF